MRSGRSQRYWCWSKWNPDHSLTSEISWDVLRSHSVACWFIGKVRICQWRRKSTSSHKMASRFHVTYRDPAKYIFLRSRDMHSATQTVELSIMSLGDPVITYCSRRPARCIDTDPWDRRFRFEGDKKSTYPWHSRSSSSQPHNLNLSMLSFSFHVRMHHAGNYSRSRWLQEPNHDYRRR